MRPSLRKYYSDPLYRNSIALLLNYTSTSFFGLFFWVLAAREISSYQVGLATTAIAAGTLILELARLGFDNGMTRFLPGSDNKRGLFNAILITTFVIGLLFTGIFLAGLEFFSPPLVFLQTGLPLLIFVAYMGLNEILLTQNRVLIAIRRSGLSFIQILTVGLRVPILFFLISLNATGILASFVIATLAADVVGAFLLRPYGLLFEFRFDAAALRGILGYSLGNYTATIEFLAPTLVIPLLITNTVGAQNSAYFYIAYSLTALLSMIPSAVSLSLFVEGSHDAPLRQTTENSLKLTALLMIPVFFALFFFGDKILGIFSQEYAEQAFQLLQLLAVSGLFSALIAIWYSIKRIQKDIKMINYIGTAYAILLIASAYVTLLLYGLIGVGYAWLGSSVLICMLIIWTMRKRDHWI
jgi:O-antigen/teichoic acid export membrane protein